MGIHQLSVHHDPQQDRLLLRLSTLSGEEFRFWLTRRLLQRLMPALEQSMQRVDASRAGVTAIDPSSRQMVSELSHAQSLQQSDFKTPFAPQTRLPLGEAPMLITDVQLSVTANADLALLFQDKSTEPARQCEVRLNSPLVHGWMHLMGQALQAADWSLQPTSLASPDNTEPTVAAAYRH